MRNTGTRAFMLGVFVIACSGPDTAPAPFEADVRFSAHGAAPQNYGAQLSGDQETTPVETDARGTAIFQLSRDGTELSYRLIVSNIDNVTQAHIHCGPAGVNGPIVVWLYPSAPPLSLIPGRTDGVLNSGVATDANVIARPDSPACPGGVADLDDVVAKLQSGGAYANVHTTAHPPGEIRGVISPRGD